MSLPHPFDEEAFLRRQEGLEAAVESGTRFYDAQLARHLREVRQLHAELIATRQHARTLAARVAEFEQGQGLPLGPNAEISVFQHLSVSQFPSATNQTPPSP